MISFHHNVNHDVDETFPCDIEKLRSLYEYTSFPYTM